MKVALAGAGSVGPAIAADLHTNGPEVLVLEHVGFEGALVGVRGEDVPPAELQLVQSGERHEVDEAAAGADLPQADRRLGLLHRAAEDIDVEAQHRLHVVHAQLNQTIGEQNTRTRPRPP